MSLPVSFFTCTVVSPAPMTGRSELATAELELLLEIADELVVALLPDGVVLLCMQPHTMRASAKMPMQQIVMTSVVRNRFMSAHFPRRARGS